jgi:hypothetical protein
MSVSTNRMGGRVSMPRSVGKISRLLSASSEEWDRVCPGSSRKREFAQSRMLFTYSLFVMRTDER